MSTFNVCLFGARKSGKKSFAQQLSTGEFLGDGAAFTFLMDTFMRDTNHGPVYINLFNLSAQEVAPGARKTGAVHSGAFFLLTPDLRDNSSRSRKSRSFFAAGMLQSLVSSRSGTRQPIRPTKFSR